MIHLEKQLHENRVELHKKFDNIQSSKLWDLVKTHQATYFLVDSKLTQFQTSEIFQTATIQTITRFK